MIRSAVMRGVNSFVYAIGISTVIQLIVMVYVGRPEMIPVLPEFAAHFSNAFMALLVQNVLIGVISASFGIGSVIMELEHLSLVTQSILYFILTTAVWYPVGCLCFGLNKYPGTMVVMGISYTVSYIWSWMIQYRICKRNVEEINRKLQQIRKEEAEKTYGG